MKKQFHILTNESAFYLPFVLIIAVITLSIITTSIMIYRQELSMTNNIIEQVEIETLIQIARAKFIIEQMYNESLNGQVMYELPHGNVNLLYHYTSDEIVELHFQVETEKQSVFEIIHEVSVQ